MLLIMMDCPRKTYLEGMACEMSEFNAPEQSNFKNSHGVS